MILGDYEVKESRPDSHHPLSTHYGSSYLLGTHHEYVLPTYFEGLCNFVGLCNHTVEHYHTYRRNEVWRVVVPAITVLEYLRYGLRYDLLS